MPRSTTPQTGLIEVSDKLSSGLEVAAFTSKNEVVGIVKMSKGFTEISNETSGEIGKPVMILMGRKDILLNGTNDHFKLLRILRKYIPLFLFLFFSSDMFPHPTLST